MPPLIFNLFELSLVLVGVVVVLAILWVRDVSLPERLVWAWPLVLGLWAFVLAYLLVMPWACSAVSYGNGQNLPTTCASLIGIGWPAVAGGLANRAADLSQTTRVASGIGIGVFLITLGRMLWHRRDTVERFVWHQGEVP
jgi:hypothetical protein